MLHGFIYLYAELQVKNIDFIKNVALVVDNRVLTFNETSPQFTLPRVVTTVLLKLIPIGRPTLAICLGVKQTGSELRTITEKLMCCSEM